MWKYSGNIPVGLGQPKVNSIIDFHDFHENEPFSGFVRKIEDIESKYIFEELINKDAQGRAH